MSENPEPKRTRGLTKPKLKTPENPPQRLTEADLRSEALLQTHQPWKATRTAVVMIICMVESRDRSRHLAL